jgi:hypothetical protein
MLPSTRLFYLLKSSPTSSFNPTTSSSLLLLRKNNNVLNQTNNNYGKTQVGRRFFGGHGHSSGSSSGAEYGNFHEPHVATWHKTAGDVMMTTMFLWIFYRAKEDFLFLIGVQHPWDAHHHSHDDHHGHGSNGNSSNGWIKDAPGERPKRGNSDEHSDDHKSGH